MGEPLYEITGRLNPKDVKTFTLTIKSDSKKLIKESIEKYRPIRDNIEMLELKYFLKYYSQYPEKFLIFDIDPVVYDDKKDVYYYTLYCCGDDELDSKMDILKQFFEKFYGGRR